MTDTLKYTGCNCGASHEHVQIQMVYATAFSDLYVIGCTRCGEFIPVMIDEYRDAMRISDKCWEAWNTRANHAADEGATDKAP